MSRMTTSRPSLSVAMAAIRRACSKRLDWLRGFPGARLVKAGAADELRNRGRNLGTHVLTVLEAAAQVTRGDRRRLDLEERDALGMGKLREHRVEALLWKTGPRRDGEPDTAEHLLRLLPGEEVAELVRADQEHGALPLRVIPQRVDRTAVPVEDDLVLRERGLRQLEAGRGGGLHPLVPRSGRDEDDDVIEAERVLRAPHELHVAAVRRVERAPEEPHGHASSNSSSPSSTVAPFRAPAALSARSSSSSEGGPPTTR